MSRGTNCDFPVYSFSSQLTVPEPVKKQVPDQIHTRSTLRSLAMAVVGALTLNSCTLSISNVGATSAADASAQQAAALAAQALVPDASLYTTQTFDWRDESRHRDVPARLYLPASRPGGDHSLPLVVFSHGIGGSREGYKYLGRYFAANGYASLHLQHVGSDRQLWFGNPFSLLGRLGDAANETEAIDRVRDLSFALDQLLAGDFGPAVDRRRIIAAGHSYGANTTMLAAGAVVERDGKKMQMRDPRIKAAILLSAPPFYGAGDPGAILSGIDIPTLHITATGDDIQIPGYYSGVNDRIEVYQAIGRDRRAPKALAVFKDGSHSIFTDRLGTGGIELNPKVKAATRDLAVAFMNSVFEQDNGALGRWQQHNAGLLAQFEQNLVAQ
jgi:dienelactone hydrolase